MSSMKLIMENFKRSMNEQMQQRTDMTTGQRVRGCRGDDQSEYCQVLRGARRNFNEFLARAKEMPKFQKIAAAVDAGLSPSQREQWFEKIASAGVNPDEPDLPELEPRVLDRLLKSVAPKFKNFSIENKKKYLGFLEDSEGELTLYGEFLEAMADALSAREYKDEPAAPLSQHIQIDKPLSITARPSRSGQ